MLKIKNLHPLLAIAIIALLLGTSCNKSTTTTATKPLSLKPAGIAYLSEAKSNVSAAVVRDTVYIFGGSVNNVTPSKKIEMFDVATQTTSVLPEPLNQAAGGCAVVGDNVYLFGEEDIQIFNTKTKKITATLPNKLTNFWYPEAVALGDKIYLMGGGASGKRSSAIWIFNTKDSSVTTAPAQTKELFLDLAVVGRKIYICYSDLGSNPWEVFDPLTNIITLTKFAPNLSNGPGITVVGNTIFILGGYEYKKNEYTDSIISFNSILQTQQTMPITLKKKKDFLKAVTANNGKKIIVLGGREGGTKDLNEIEIFDVIQ